MSIKVLSGPGIQWGIRVHGGPITDEALQRETIQLSVVERGIFTGMEASFTLPFHSENYVRNK